MPQVPETACSFTCGRKQPSENAINRCYQQGSMLQGAYNEIQHPVGDLQASPEPLLASVRTVTPSVVGLLPLQAAQPRRCVCMASKAHRKFAACGSSFARPGKDLSALRRLCIYSRARKRGSGKASHTNWYPFNAPLLCCWLDLLPYRRCQRCASGAPAGRGSGAAAGPPAIQPHQHEQAPAGDGRLLLSSRWARVRCCQR